MRPLDQLVVLAICLTPNLGFGYPMFFSHRLLTTSIALSAHMFSRSDANFAEEWNK